MIQPKDIDKITLLERNGFGTILPFGFVFFEEENDGAGNYFGLYWRFGKEDLEPIICWYDHEEGTLNPEFPNLNCFLRWMDCEDRDNFVFLDDEELFLPFYNRGKLLSIKNKSNEAIKYLEYSIKLFDEYSDSWHYISKEYQKTNLLDKSSQSAINSIKSNWIFGFPTQKAIENFIGLQYDKSVYSDPLFQRKDKLELNNSYPTGFTVDFKMLRECINEYHELKDYKSAALLNQNYGFIMSFENERIHNENDFDLKKWQNDFVDYCKKYLNDRNYGG